MVNYISKLLKRHSAFALYVGGQNKKPWGNRFGTNIFRPVSLFGMGTISDPHLPIARQKRGGAKVEEEGEEGF